MRNFDPNVDYYAIIGVAPTASKSEIAKAYHKLAARYHPDKHQGNELEDLAKEKLTQLNQAYDVLRDTQSRAQYDSFRMGRIPGSMPGGAAGTKGTPTTRRGLFSTVRSIFVIVLIFAALPYIFRIVKNPKALIVIAIAIAVAWFGPRIVRYFKN